MNSRPIREKARKAYEKARKEFEKAQSQKNAFERIDLPEFQKWLFSRLGALLTEFRNIEHALREKEDLFVRVQAYAFTECISPATAYRRMQKSEFQEPSQNTGKRSRSAPHKRDAEDAAWNDEDFEFPLNDDFFMNPFAGLQEKNPASPEKTRSLKSLYRILARKLHPDAGQDLSPKALEWWHKVQEAYQAQDVEQLELLLALYEMENGNGNFDTGVSILQRMTQSVQSALRTIQRELSGMRSHPGWKFTKQKDLAALQIRVEKDLREQIAQSRELLSQMIEEIAQWERRPKKRRPKSETGELS